MAAAVRPSIGRVPVDAFNAPSDRLATVFDQGEPTGDGLLLIAGNLGQVTMFDYRTTGVLNASTPNRARATAGCGQRSAQHRAKRACARHGHEHGGE